MQDVPARKPDAARAHLRQLRMRRVEPAHVVRRIARPALAADVLVEPAVAVGHDVQPGHFLLPQIHRQRVHILLAEPRLITIASRNDRVPRFSVYQLGRGSEPGDRRRHASSPQWPSACQRQSSR